MQRLDDVTDLVPGNQLPNWTASRRNTPYETVLWFATMVLRQRAIDLPIGAVDVNGFMIDMATWYRGGKPVAVIDAKYKAEKPAGYPNADLYQLLGYCTVLGLPAGYLVYAKGTEQAIEITVRGSGTVIHAHALDLAADPSALLAQVDALAQTVAAKRHSER